MDKTEKPLRIMRNGFFLIFPQKKVQAMPVPFSPTIMSTYRFKPLYILYP